MMICGYEKYLATDETSCYVTSSEVITGTTNDIYNSYDYDCTHVSTCSMNIETPKNVSYFEWREYISFLPDIKREPLSMKPQVEVCPVLTRRSMPANKVLHIKRKRRKNN